MTLASPYPDVEIPDASVTDYLFGAAADHADHPALIDSTSGNEISYGQLVHMVDRVAAGLAERGIGKGDVVGVFIPNTPYWAVVFHGILRAGAVATTINSLYSADEVAFQLSDADAKLLFTVSPFLDRADKAAEQVGLDPATQVIPIDGADGRGGLADLIATTAPSPQPTIDPATDLAVLPYSSGTTGLPKGVMLTHRNLVANLAQIESLLRPENSERVLAVLPFFHIYGMQVVLNLYLKNGKTVVTMPKFELPDFLATIQDHRTDMVFIAPPVAVALAKHPMVDSYDVSAMKVLFSGAAPFDKQLADAVIARLGVKVRQGYGMTEMSPVSHGIRVDDAGDAMSIGTIGQIIANTECRVVDPETGQDGHAGELWVRGPQVMRGYLNNEKATAETIVEDGWLRTGDIVEVADGLFTVVDRLKELIKVSGYQVPPAELEALLLTHPGIADAAVIGIPDEKRGEVPKAFVVKQADADGLTEDAVMEFVAERIAPHKKIRSVAFIDAVPKSASGKILRKDLKTL